MQRQFAALYLDPPLHCGIERRTRDGDARDVRQGVLSTLMSVSVMPLTSSPCRYPRFFDKYQQSKASFWTPEEVDLSQDQRDWNSLTGEESGCSATVL